jgi:tetratricopeptide (TPR) repeat protein
MANRLAICLIARDEAANLPRCLGSLAGLDARVYLTDTGSQDYTPEIAASHGAEVRHFPWVNDFSAARNFSISNVPEDWILNLDADDYFPEGEAERIPSFLEGSSKIAFTLAYEVEEGSTPARGFKLFRNRLGIRFEGIIHEYVRNSLARFGPEAVGALPVLLKHTGYSREALARKVNRNLPLLQREWERSRAVADWPQTQYIGKKLAEDLFARGQATEAETMLRELLETMLARGERHATDWQATLLTNLLSHYHETSQDREALLACARFEPVFGDHPLFALYRGVTRMRSGAFPEALDDLDRFEHAALASVGDLSIPRPLLGAELWNYQGICRSALGDAEGAFRVFSKAAAAAPANPEYQTRLKLSSLALSHGTNLEHQTRP